MLIKLDEITKYYYSSTSVSMALQKVSLEFDKGEFVAITGESGSGKSTLLNVISGLTSYEEGELYIDGVTTSSFGSEEWDEFRKNKIGFVFQDYNLIEKYSALENVMAAMIIMGCDKKTAKKHSMEILSRVGLKNFANQRASRLSSGQKQRLSIARALAKGTDIIVADEPTGNLDSETGKQIVELFASLAGEKLIIMVTHNYEQAKDYVTRQVRLYDGVVVSDETVSHTSSHAASDEPPVQEERADKSAEKGKKTIGTAAAAMLFTRMDFRRQPVAMMFIAIFILIVSVASFVFMGQIYANYDDINTRIYSSTIYAKEDNCRISVLRQDGKSLTAEDIATLQNVKYVEAVEKYDAVSDINYAYIPEVDYLEDTDVWSVYEINGSLISNSQIKILNYDKFVCSSTCISESDLAEGKLPESRYEVVAYAGAEGLYAIGDTIKCYFENTNSWNGELMSHDFTVCGILKEPTDQLYFSEDYCNMLSYSVFQPELTIYGGWCVIYDEYAYDESVFIPFIDESLEDGEISLSVNYDLELDAQYKTMLHKSCPHYEFWYGSEVNLKLDTTDEYIDGYILDQDAYISAETFNNNGNCFIGINENLFRTFFPEGSTQCGLYIKDYAYTDKVIKQIEELGYEGISTIRAGSVEYDNDKLYNRMMILVIAISAIVVLAVMDVFIVTSMFKVKKKDYSVLHSMGAAPKICRFIAVFQVNIVTVVTLILTVAVMFILDSKGIKSVHSMLVYMDWWKYVVYAVYNLVLAQLIALLFNRYIAKQWRKVEKTK